MKEPIGSFMHVGQSRGRESVGVNLASSICIHASQRLLFDLYQKRRSWLLYSSTTYVIGLSSKHISKQQSQERYTLCS
jgi:hypothetical protein